MRTSILLETFCKDDDISDKYDAEITDQDSMPNLNNCLALAMGRPSSLHKVPRDPPRLQITSGRMNADSDGYVDIPFMSEWLYVSG